jgi:hypothetical protein
MARDAPCGSAPDLCAAPGRTANRTLTRRAAAGFCGATAFASDHADACLRFAHPYNPFRGLFHRWKLRASALVANTHPMVVKLLYPDCAELTAHNVADFLVACV